MITGRRERVGRGEGGEINYKLIISLDIRTKDAQPTNVSSTSPSESQRQGSRLS
jgi:hypothetical protein